MSLIRVRGGALRQVREGAPRRAMIAALGLLIAGSSGAILVQAAESPHVRAHIVQFNRPIRQQVEYHLPREMLRLAPLRREERMPVHHAPGAARAIETSPPAARTAIIRPPVARAAAIKPNLQKPAEGAIRARHALIRRGMPAATNYCVRLCDGFAFPLGAVGAGLRAQEAACRNSCPGAETALYSLPAGARDLDQLRQGSARYTALASAFRYREHLNPACACRPVGATQSSAALLADPSLRRGDLVMTRIGMRHFDGSARFPYPAAAFSDALPRVPKREIAIVRALEMASVRGILAEEAAPRTRARVIAGLKAEAARAETLGRAARGSGAPGFAELSARDPRAPAILPVVRRAPGLVALN
jgi:hypothetical protein